MEISEIEAILKIFKESDISEFEFERGGTKLKLVRGSSPAPQYVSPISNINTTSSLPFRDSKSSLEANEIDFKGLDPRLVKMESPIVGTFYRKPSPEARPFVEEGDRVTKGQTLCIVEAMKLMNEIESPTSGVIEKVCVGDGTVVEFGEVLFLIRSE
jgi:acetyl-CoA carboxylase biotin carboxyl carrier protein